MNSTRINYIEGPMETYYNADTKTYGFYVVANKIEF
jgi:hypothetical protein